MYIMHSYADILKTTPLKTTLRAIYMHKACKICHIIGIQGRDFTDMYINMHRYIGYVYLLIKKQIKNDETHDF